MKKYLETTPIPWRLLAILLLVHIVLGAYYLLRPGNPAFFRLFMYIANTLDALGLGLLCFKGSRALLWPRVARPAFHASGRLSPALLGMSLICFGVSLFIWLFSREILHLPRQVLEFPALQHFTSLGMYPFLICAVLLLPSPRQPLIARIRLLLDSLMIMVALATLCYYFILAPLLAGGKGTLLAKIMMSIFPAIDLVFMFCLLLVMLSFGKTALRPVLIMLGLTAISLFTMHITHLYELLYTGYQPFSSANALYMLDGVLIVGAAQTVRRILERDRSEEGLSSVEKVEQTGLLSQTGRWKSILPSALVLIFGLLVVSIWLTGGARHFHGNLLIVYIGGFVVLLFMVFRQFLAVHEVNILQKTLWSKNRSLRLLNKQLEQQAITDALTELPNHQALVNYLDIELARAKAQQSICSILFIDIDHFKSLNDKYGHLVGDTILRQFSSLIEATLRSTDYLGRWGGEEFLAVLPGTSGSNALAVAERIRLQVARHVFAHERGGLRLTCSLGLATYPDDANQREMLVMLADTAMYAAKRLGRNQTRVAREPSVLTLGRVAEAPQALEERRVLGVVEALLALQEGRDRPTSQHERRVAALARKLALNMGLSEEEAYIVSLGGLLHDLGKVALPDQLLLKRGKLTEEEFRSVRAHPVTGSRVLSEVPILHEITSIVRSHHEWMDGSGYPDKLAGEAIPLGARIVAVADAYDVITHHRPYQHAHSSAEALYALQKNAGRQFDPHAVTALVHLLAHSSS